MDENNENKPKAEWKDVHSIGVIALLVSVVPQVEVLHKILGPEFVSDVIKFLIAYTLVLVALRKEVKRMYEGIQGHVAIVEAGLDKMHQSVNLVAVNVKALKESLESLESTHSSRISKLENDVTNIQTKIGDKNESNL